MRKWIQGLKSRRTVLVLLSLLLVVVISTGGTIAYFSGGDEARTVFTMGQVSLTFEEPGWAPENGEQVKPGWIAEKDPTVTVTEGDCYMRIRMEIVDGEDNPLTDEKRIGLILQTLWCDKADGVIDPQEKYTAGRLQSMAEDGALDAEYDRDRFTFAGIEQGKPSVRYYHYNGIFRAGDEAESAATLFTHVLVPTDWHNAELFTLSGDTFETLDTGAVEIVEKGSGYKIILSAEAIQSAEMESADAAFAALDEATGVVRVTEEGEADEEE